MAHSNDGRCRDTGCAEPAEQRRFPFCPTVANDGWLTSRSGRDEERKGDVCDTTGSILLGVVRTTLHCATHSAREFFGERATLSGLVVGNFLQRNAREFLI